MTGIVQRRLHVIPVEDSGPHEGIHAASELCWCSPFFDGDAFVHHAHDCREAQERNDPDFQSPGWILIAEMIEVNHEQ